MRATRKPSPRLASNTAIVAVAALWACGSGERRAADSAQPDTSSTPAPSTAAPSDTSRGALIARGDSIFKGQLASGLCYSCHGPDAKGTTLAPILTDKQWINIDGSLESIVSVISNGVPQPKEHAAPMPPMGGAQLTPDQIRALATYVYSLSHS